MILLQSAPPIALVFEPTAQEEVRLSVAGLKTNRFPGLANISVPIALMAQYEGEVGMGVGFVWIQPDGLALFGDRAGPGSLSRQGGTQFNVRSGIFRHQPDCFAIFPQGSLSLAFLGQGPGEIFVRPG